mmetsp:Transcript_7803/g.13148  ORF Transcript_7803/g.13148 Transcript_7803/m.13148 type:complete len:206 (+) Transcript_7803:584-1201(+)
MVGARLRAVGLASLAGVHILPVTASGHTLGSEESPGSGGLAAIAAHGKAAGDASAAGKSVLGGQHGGGITGLDAAAVVVGLGGAEGPTRAAVGLVAHHTGDGGALGPVGAHIERFGDGRRGSEEGLLLNLRLKVAFFMGEHSSQKMLNISHGGVLELSVGTGLPSGGLGVDLGDHGRRSGVHGGAQVKSGGANKGRDEESRLHFK